MTTFTVTEKVTGQYPKRFKGIDLRATMISILLSPIRLVSMFNKGYSDVSDSKWEHLFVDDSFKIEKRIIAKAGFDDCILFYNLASSDKKLNEIIRLKYFADFIIKTNKGVFLRQFKTPKDWPNSTILYIPFDTYKIEKVAKSNSSWTNWTYSFIDDKQIKIVTETTEEYSKSLIISSDF